MTHRPWLLAAILILTSSPVLALQDRERDRDQHFRKDPARQHQLENYTPPRVYYPRRDQDKVRVKPVQPAPSITTPSYGAPPPAIKRIPKT
jgi:hypothetical protein